MYLVPGTSSFQSLWYWALTILVWGLVLQRTLGVPNDMVLRAHRQPDAARNVDDLARITATRIGAIHDAVGVPMAALAGFVLAGLFVAGFLSGLEVAKALFLLAFPLMVVAYSTLRLALAVRRKRQTGADLRRSLVKRRIWHTVIAWAALAAAVSVALLDRPAV